MGRHVWSGGSSNIVSQGFGRPSTWNLVDNSIYNPQHSPAATSLLANTPQILVSYIYLTYDNLFHQHACHCRVSVLQRTAAVSPRGMGPRPSAVAEVFVNTIPIRHSDHDCINNSALAHLAKPVPCKSHIIRLQWDPTTRSCYLCNGILALRHHLCALCRGPYTSGCITSRVAEEVPCDHATGGLQFGIYNGIMSAATSVDGPGCLDGKASVGCCR